MRLTDNQVTIIINSFHNCFDETDHLWLFGSRVHDEKRGGDIDLYIETMDTDISRVVHKKMEFIAQLWQAMGEQKIDVVINQLQRHHPLPIYGIAKKTGIRLA